MKTETVDPRDQLLIIREYFDGKYSQPFTLEINWSKQQVTMFKGAWIVTIRFVNIPGLGDKKLEKIK